MLPLAELAVLASEITLASYPILIKAVDTNLFTQVFSRMAIYSGLALVVLLGSTKGLGAVSAVNTAGAGLLNLLHVATSYKAFSDLPAGNAMAIFYAYPIWNLLGAWLLLGESIPYHLMPWVALAAIGMLCIAQPDVGTIFNTEKPLGLLSAVLSGITESAIYFFFRFVGKEESTFKGMLELYGGSFLWMLPAVFFGSSGFFSKMQLPKLDFSWKVWAPMILFNALIGFTGYTARFVAIPLVSTIVFSTLSFFGIVAAYIFGYLFQGEKPSRLAMLGSAAIIVANGAILSQSA